MHKSTAVFLALLLATTTTHAADKVPPTGAPQAMPVIVAPVVKKDLAQTISAVGSLVASESADIHSEIAGKIEKINFVEGSVVKKGDVLLEIDSSLIRTELAKANALYKVASSTLGRDDKLYASKYISAQELDESKSTLQQQKADVDSARIRLDKTLVKAPFDGMVGLRSFSVGDYVEVGKVLTTIDAYDPIKLEFSIPERNFADIRPDQKITFLTDAWPGVTFEGQIYAIDSRVNPQTRSVQVKATAPNTDGKMRAGMYARVSIETSVDKDALVIPEESLVSQGDKDFVYAVQDGKAVLQPVEIISRQQGTAAVKGLQEGDTVVSAGVQRIRDGMAVIAQKTQ